MISLYIAGKKVGTLADFDRIISDESTKNRIIEFLDDAGTQVGKFTPEKRAPADEPIIPWEPEVTLQDIEKRMQEPGYTWEEMQKRLGLS
jgi:hypothetical protein